MMNRGVVWINPDDLEFDTIPGNIDPLEVITARNQVLDGTAIHAMGVPVTGPVIGFDDDTGTWYFNGVPISKDVMSLLAEAAARAINHPERRRVWNPRAFPAQFVYETVWEISMDDLRICTPIG